MKPYLRYTFRLIWRQKKSFMILSALVLFEAGLRLVQPYFYKIIVDALTDGIVSKVFSDAQLRLMLLTILLWFFCAIVNNVVNAQVLFLSWKVAHRSSQWAHMEGFRKLLRLDYRRHSQKHSSQYAKILDEGDTSVWEMTNWWLNRFLSSIVGFIAMLIIALSVSWQMTLVSLSVIPPGLAVIIFMIKKYEDEQYKVNKLWTLKHEHLSDQVANIITYKLNQDEKLFMDVQQGFVDRSTDAQLALNKKWRITGMLNPDSIARFLVMGMGVLLVKDGKITLGTLFMFMGLLNEILVPLHLLGDILPQYSRRARHIDKQLKLIDEKDVVVDPKHPKKIGEVLGRIEFKNVSYQYDHDGDDSKKSFAIKNLSFVIEAGQQVALVGHSGAGKSTIMALMTRLVDPIEGAVLLDGVDIREYRQADYRKLLGTVLQENSLYNETVAQNIAYGNPKASRAEIIEAAKKAAADEYIEKLPKTYDTFIGERGVRLSGGEKQRLAIARAILKNPKIIVLDEPTSALDSITEAKVQRGLILLVEGRSSLIIAHRLSTVRNADKILFMRNGELRAMGSHSELIKISPEYAQMVELQIGGFLKDE